MFEVFNYRTGQTVTTVPFAWLARIVVRLYGRGHDYAAQGEGWV